MTEKKKKDTAPTPEQPQTPEPETKAEGDVGESEVQATRDIQRKKGYAGTLPSSNTADAAEKG